MSDVVADNAEHFVLDGIHFREATAMFHPGGCYTGVAAFFLLNDVSFVKGRVPSFLFIFDTS